MGLVLLWLLISTWRQLSAAAYAEQTQAGALRQSTPLRLDGRRVPVQFKEASAKESAIPGCWGVGKKRPAEAGAFRGDLRLN